MKSIIYALAIGMATFILTTNSTNSFATASETYATAEKLDIKIKNDTDDEVSVINAGSGGSYRLQKNVATTIKMEEGDELYIYEKGKKGKLLLTASKSMNGKLQLLSKL